MRVPREAVLDNEMWFPSDTQFGTEWVPAKVGDLLVGFANSLGADEGRTRDNVKWIFWLSVLQLALALLPILTSCCSLCCKNEDGRDKKNAAAGSGNSFVALLIGLLGVMAVKFDCKELLMAVVIMALVSLLFTAIWLLIALCGFAVFCCSAEGCGERIWALISLIIAVVWILLASFINVMLVVKGWPFCFGESLDDTVDGINSN